MHVACCVRLLHVASFRPHGTCSGSHVAYSGCMLHGRVVRCTARASRVVIAGCTNCRTLRMTAASRDSRCMLHVASSMMRVARRRYGRVAAATPTDGVALAHSRQLVHRQLFLLGGTPINYTPHPPPPPPLPPLPPRFLCPFVHTPVRRRQRSSQWFGRAAPYCGHSAAA